MIVLGCVIIASGIDLYMDLAHGTSTSHLAKEAAIVLLASGLVSWMFLEQRQQTKKIMQLKYELANHKTNPDKMSKDVQAMRKQLSELVRQQFEEWQLTASEKEVGWLLLKGLSLKEISLLRNTLEKTVRQQASAIYKKANVSGRHAFSAWFIEDLL